MTSIAVLSSANDELDVRMSGTNAYCCKQIQGKLTSLASRGGVLGLQM
ncbi:MAG: hypothetical protein AAGA46_08545 [Cyanobacteria bacterium P01_F01_bin.13]